MSKKKKGVETEKAAVPAALPIPSAEQTSNRKLADFAREKRLRELKERNAAKAPSDRGKTAAPSGGGDTQKLPRLPRKSKGGQPCFCGCGGTTRGGRFMPGHDAVLYGLVRRVMNKKMSISDVPAVNRKQVEKLIAAGGPGH